MTANAMEGDRDRCLQAGMNDYIAKPIRQADLLAVIRRVTSGDAAPVTAMAKRGGGAMFLSIPKPRRATLAIRMWFARWRACCSSNGILT